MPVIPLKVGTRVVVLEGAFKDGVPADEVGTIQTVIKPAHDWVITASKGAVNRSGEKRTEWYVCAWNLAPLKPKKRVVKRG